MPVERYTIVVDAKGVRTVKAQFDQLAIGATSAATALELLIAAQQKTNINAGFLARGTLAYSKALREGAISMEVFAKKSVLTTGIVDAYTASLTGAIPIFQRHTLGLQGITLAFTEMIGVQQIAVASQGIVADSITRTDQVVHRGLASWKAMDVELGRLPSLLSPVTLSTNAVTVALAKQNAALAAGQAALLKWQAAQAAGNLGATLRATLAHSRALREGAVSMEVFAKKSVLTTGIINTYTASLTGAIPIFQRYLLGTQGISIAFTEMAGAAQIAAASQGIVADSVARADQVLRQGLASWTAMDATLGRLPSLLSPVVLSMDAVTTALGRQNAALSTNLAAYVRWQSAQAGVFTSFTKLSGASQVFVATQNVLVASTEGAAAAFHNANAAAAVYASGMRVGATSAEHAAVAAARLTATLNLQAAVLPKVAGFQTVLTAAQKQFAAASATAAVASQRFTATLFSLKNIIGVLALVAIVDMIDTYQNLQNRLRVVTTGSEELASVTRELFDIAQRTRFTFEDTAETYARMAFNTRELGLSQQELFDITETLNQALIVGGARTQEGSNALIQLSQAFATGRLRADEFRAVTEQLPVVADAIAAHFDVARGDLLRLSIQGRITAKDMIEAFQKADTSIRDKFEKTIPTIQQSINRLRNALQLVFGEINSDTELGQKFADIVLKIVENIDRLKLVIVLLGKAILFIIGKNLLVFLVRQIWTLTSAAISAVTGIGTLSIGMYNLARAASAAAAGTGLLNAALGLLAIPALVVLAETLAVLGAIGVVVFGVKFIIEDKGSFDEAVETFLKGPPVDPLGNLIAAWKVFSAGREARELDEILSNAEREINESVRKTVDRISPMTTNPFGEVLEQQFKIGFDFLPVTVALDDQLELLKMGNLEREKTVRLNRIIKDLGRPLNPRETERTEEKIARNIAAEDSKALDQQIKQITDRNALIGISVDRRTRLIELARIDGIILGELTRGEKDRVRIAVQTGIDKERSVNLQKRLNALAQENQILQIKDERMQTITRGILAEEDAIGASIVGQKRDELILALAINFELNKKEEKTVAATRTFAQELQSLKDQLEITKLIGDERALAEVRASVELAIDRELLKGEREKLDILTRQRLEVERLQSIGSTVDNLLAENDILRANVDQRELLTALREHELSIGRDLERQEEKVFTFFFMQNQKLRERNEILASVRGPNDEFIRKLETIDFLYRKQILSLREYKIAMRQAFDIGTTPLEDTVQRLNDLAAAFAVGSIKLDEFKRRLPEALGIATHSSVLEEINEEQAKWNLALDLGVISLSEHEAALRSLNVEMLNVFDLERSGIIQFFKGIEAGFRSLELELDHFGELIRDWIVDGFRSAEDAVVSFAKTGKFEFRDFASALAEDLLRIATRLLIVQAILQTIAIFNALSGNILGGGGGGAFIDSPIGGSGSTGILAQHGAQFMVGGSGGPDSQMVSFRASPGEEVSVRTPDQQQKAQQGSGQQPTMVQVVNVLNPDDMVAAIGTPGGTTQIINVIEQNPDVIRAIVGS